MAIERNFNYTFPKTTYSLKIVLISFKPTLTYTNMKETHVRSSNGKLVKVQIPFFLYIQTRERLKLSTLHELRPTLM